MWGSSALDLGKAATVDWSAPRRNRPPDRGRRGRPPPPGIGPLLAGVGAACGLDAVGPEPGDLGDEGARGRLVEVGEPAAAAHAAAGAQLEAEVSCGRSLDDHWNKPG